MEVMATARIKEAIRVAMRNVGRNDFASIAGLTTDQLDHLLTEERAYIGVTIVSLACRINKTHGEPSPYHSSVSECLKGATIRLPEPQARIPDNGKPSSETPRGPVRPGQSQARFYDQKSAKLLGFGGNTLALLVLGYFLGGTVLAPSLGLRACVGVSFSPPAVTPCLGSIIGLVIGAFAGLGYTAYYFIKKM